MEKVAIRNPKQFELLADLFVKRVLELQRAKCTKAEAVKKAQADFDRQGRRLEDILDKLEKAFAKYLRRNEALLDGKKSIQVGRLLLGFRTGNPILLDKETENGLEPQELVERIQSLMEDGNSGMRKELKETLKTEVKPVLSAIKALSGRVLDGLQLEVHQNEDFFWKIIE